MLWVNQREGKCDTTARIGKIQVNLSEGEVNESGIAFHT